MVEKKYLKVKCLDCGEEKKVFTRASSVVKCEKCNADVALPTGGKAKILGEIIEFV